MVLKIFIIVIVLGEGGFGGVFVIGVGDYIMMFENVIYFILLFEGFVLILFKDSICVNEVVYLMKFIVEDLKLFGIIDEIILEGKGLNIDFEVGYINLKK